MANNITGSIIITNKTAELTEEERMECLKKAMDRITFLEGVDKTWKDYEHDMRMLKAIEDGELEPEFIALLTLSNSEREHVEKNMEYYRIGSGLHDALYVNPIPTVESSLSNEETERFVAMLEAEEESYPWDDDWYEQWRDEQAALPDYGCIDIDWDAMDKVVEELDLIYADYIDKELPFN